MLRLGWRTLGALLLASTLQAGASEVTLAWNDNSNDEMLFKIERSTASSAYAQIATVGANVTSYIDATVSPATSYSYRVRASNATADSAYTNVLTVTTPSAANIAPVISDIPSITLVAGTSTGARGFTVSDAETAAGSLVVAGSSSNTTLVPNSAIVFGGSGNSRTVNVTPAATQSGSATITVTVSDGALTANDTFTVTVSAAPTNTAPTITTIASQMITAGGNTGPLAFTVGDAQTAAGSLTVTRGSSNTGLIPLSNVVLGGIDANRTVTVSTAAGQSGTSTITLNVSDGVLTTSSTFTVTTLASNTPPVISDIANSTIEAGTSTSAKSFTVSDVETAAASLTVTASSSNTTLVSNAAIVFGGSGSSRTVTVTPAAAQSGSANITVTVSDGSLTASDSFVLTVNPAAEQPEATMTFSNTSPIAIRNKSSEATLYPASINVTGMTGLISNVTVRLNNFSQSRANDMDVLLVSPSGQKMLLMSDVGTGPTSDATLTFSDKASAYLPETGSLTSGTYKPTNYGTTSDNLSAPAPAGPFANSFTTFQGQNPNGTWKLFVRDEGSGQNRRINNGWTLNISTSSAATSGASVLEDAAAGSLEPTF